MQCLGRRRDYKRCTRNANLVFCHQHRWQGLTASFALLTTIGLVAGLYQDLLKPLSVDFIDTAEQNTEFENDGGLFTDSNIEVAFRDLDPIYRDRVASKEDFSIFINDWPWDTQVIVTISRVGDDPLEDLPADEQAEVPKPEPIMEQCLGDEQSRTTILGTLKMIAYYNIFRSILSGQPIHTNTETQMPSAGNFFRQRTQEDYDSIDWNYYLRKIHARDREHILAAINALLYYRSVFDENTTETDIAVIRSKRNFSLRQFYALGLPESENSCFTRYVAMKGFYIDDNDCATYEKACEVALPQTVEGYMYGFWSRRYTENSQDAAYYFLQIAKVILIEDFYDYIPIGK